ncbi:hypothetical protein BIFGAL_04202 [Bifidobacterium gallicum DSM 20093 = LMG 11596]|uniref:Uncharacterized protein n=1 Tax=Bifidobacterium gallicum DSM 20093 = LMG 11596 TaxID=561180 RepID=D1NWF4_9BIFI|nr:hypothetical protein BIFGAL_04202 [Bifidobacterium gallicum DSM 20093 = LMG 11596]
MTGATPSGIQIPLHPCTWRMHLHRGSSRNHRTITQHHAYKSTTTFAVENVEIYVSFYPDSGRVSYNDACGVLVDQI